MESLSLELEAVKFELEQLKVENTKLRASDQEGAALIDAQVEAQRQLELYEQVMKDLTEREEENSRLLGSVKELESKLDTVSSERDMIVEEMKKVKDQSELELHRAVAKERAKWEDREERMVRQLKEARGTHFADVSPVVLTTEREQSPPESVHGGPEVEPNRTTPVTVPPIPKFSGDGVNPEESFQEWKEQFELIASLGRWDSKTRLVNLITRLRGQAYAFYRSCTASQRGNYLALMKELEKRFTPVTIQAVQTSLFHERKQGPQETMDAYAQDLRQLFLKAYPSAHQGSKEAEEMGKSVLSSQFVSGLRSDLKSKIAGMEGDMDSLLIKARFEEAKAKSLGEETRTLSKKPVGYQQEARPRGGPGQAAQSNTRISGNSHLRCHNCGGAGHFARNCPLKSKVGPVEAKGHKVAVVVPGKTESQKEAEPRPGAIEKELEEIVVALHGVQITHDNPFAGLGNTPTAELDVEGSKIEALIDTRSPVSIISSKCLLNALSQTKNPEQTPEDWAAEVKQRLKPTVIKLASYSGHKLDMHRQIRLKLGRKDRQIEAWVQVQQDAPVNFLLGTDIQPKLGFYVEEKESAPTTGGELENATKTAEDSTEPPRQVCLLEAVRVPANFKRLVPVEKIGPDTEEVMMFVPSFEKDDGLMLEEGLMGTGRKGMLPVENQGLQPILLPKGEVLGSLEKVEIMPAAVKHEGGLCGVIHEVETPALDREKRLLTSLPMDNWELDNHGKQQLITLILQYHDIFALDNNELGCAKEIAHGIDTGDQKPIKQYPRRVPFALRRKVEEMIQEMLQQGIVEPSG